MSAAGWYPDPVHRFEFRWFNGQAWTADVSVNGRRFVDDLGMAPVPQRTATFSPPAFVPGDRQPMLSKTLAVLSFIFGLGGALICWVPFLFVVGGAGAITALVLGTVSRRRIRSGSATGQGLTIAGMVLAVVALFGCIGGFFFTRSVIREILEFTEPGPLQAEVTSCSADGGRISLAGSIDNLDDRERDYVVVVEITDRGVYVTTARVLVEDVQPGEHRDWEASRLSSRLSDDIQPVCRLDDVTGPSPFGLPSD